ncbi:hypothetical protein ACROYT_G043676 [Oculina patagonica]
MWVKSLLQQAHKTIHPPPERIVWCYSQWQPTYRELLLTIPGIEFIKGIPSTLEQDSFFDVNIRNLIVIDDQMIEAGSDNRIVNLFTKGSHHRNLSVIYLVQNLFHQGKGNRSISLNSHYLVLFKNPRDKLQILTLAKQMYPGETAWFIKRYEEAVRRPFGYLFIDVKPTTQNSCRLRTNVLPGEERFDNGEVEGSISKELLQYLKQQNLIAAPVIPEMQRLRNNMDGLLSRNDLGEDEKARQYMQLQNRFLTYKHQLNSIPEATKWAEPQEKKQISTTENLPTVPTPSPELATVPATPVQAPDPQWKSGLMGPYIGLAHEMGHNFGFQEDRKKRKNGDVKDGTLPYLTLPHLTSPHLTLPYLTFSYLTLPYLTLPYLTLPYLTLPHLTSPYLTLPHLTSPYLTLPYLTLPHLTSPHLTSPHLTSPHLTSPPLPSPHLTLPLLPYLPYPHLTSPHHTSPHLTSPHLPSPPLTSPYLTSPHLTSPHLTSPHLTSPHLTSPHLTSPHLTSPHLTSPHLTSPHLTSPHLTSPHLTSPYLPYHHNTFPSNIDFSFTVALS